MPMPSFWSATRKLFILHCCAFAGAEAGTLTFMVGGNKAAADAATPILRHMGSHVIHCGDHGAGISAKICNNLVLAASMAALSEALALGKRLGLDPNVLTDVSSCAQAAGSRSLSSSFVCGQTVGCSNPM
jgi:3-hydroxyisobutyrate dehydrogenase-like beta-hydroxyacid dehydrogenase